MVARVEEVKKPINIIWGAFGAGRSYSCGGGGVGCDKPTIGEWPRRIRQ